MFFLFLLRGKKRVAYVDRSWHSKLINHPIAFDPLRAATLHQALKSLHTVAPELKEVPEELYPTLQVPKASNSKPVVLITASITRPENQLGVKRYADLLNRLGSLCPIEVLIISQPADKDRAQALAKHIRVPHQLHYPHDFDAFMVLLASGDLYFMGDGGVAHMGAALGKKGVVLFGGINPVEWHPLSKRFVALYDHKHVDNLSEEAIFQALRQHLG